MCVRGDELVGFALGHTTPYFDGELFFLDEMCVNTEAQRSDVGTKLLGRLHVELEEAGVKRFVLLTAKEAPAQNILRKERLPPQVRYDRHG